MPLADAEQRGGTFAEENKATCCPRYLYADPLADVKPQRMRIDVNSRVEGDTRSARYRFLAGVYEN